MQVEQFGTKDLYKIVMRATSNMRVGNRELQAGEPILYLDGAQIFAQGQQNGYRAARGGRHNLAHVIWETPGDVNFVIQRGVISPIGYALLTSLNVLDQPVNGSTFLTKTEILGVDSVTRKAYLGETPEEKLFVYGFKNRTMQQVIDNWEYKKEDNSILLPENFEGDSILVDYSYLYGEPMKEYRLNKERLNGFLSMEARYYTRTESGVQVTNIIYVPKVKVISDLSLRIGENVGGPALSTFNIVAMAEKVDGEYTIMRVLQLGEDVDGM